MKRPTAALSPLGPLEAISFVILVALAKDWQTGADIGRRRLQYELRAMKHLIKQGEERLT
jgi:hypothetical protein